MEMDQKTVEAICNILQTEFGQQAEAHFLQSNKHCDSYKRTQNQQHLWDSLRLGHFGRNLKGLSKTITPDWIQKITLKHKGG